MVTFVHAIHETVTDQIDKNNKIIQKVKSVI